MNPLKIVIPLALAGGLYAAWEYSPLFRSKVRKTLDHAGAWTEEARKEDPIGYMDYAIKRLEGDVDKFGQARASLKAAKREAEGKRAEYSANHDIAVELSGKLRDAYQTAEGGAGYPVAFMNKEYKREELITQVTLTLAERDTYDEVVDDFTQVIAKIDATTTELVTRTTKVKTHVTQLKAKREVLKVEKLTAETEELLATVEALIGENAETISILPEDEDPVRSLEEFMRAMELEADLPEEGQPVGDPDEAAAMQFLEG